MPFPVQEDIFFQNYRKISSNECKKSCCSVTIHYRRFDELYTTEILLNLKIRAWWYTTCLHTCMQSAAALCGAPATTCTATGESSRLQGWRKPWAIGPLDPTKFYLALLITKHKGQVRYMGVLL